MNTTVSTPPSRMKTVGIVLLAVLGGGVAYLQRTHVQGYPVPASAHVPLQEETVGGERWVSHPTLGFRLRVPDGVEPTVEAEARAFENTLRAEGAPESDVAYVLGRLDGPRVFVQVMAAIRAEELPAVIRSARATAEANGFQIAITNRASAGWEKEFRIHLVSDDGEADQRLMFMTPRDGRAHPLLVSAGGMSQEDRWLVMNSVQVR